MIDGTMIDGGEREDLAYRRALLAVGNVLVDLRDQVRPPSDVLEGGEGSGFDHISLKR